MNEKELKNSIEIFAHKIKNPVHSAIINLDVLKMKLQKQKVDQKILKHVEIAVTEVERINRIVQSYFDYLNLTDKERSKKKLDKLLS